MAKPKATTTQYSSKKPKISIFLCCFGSSHANNESTIKGNDPIISNKKKKKKNSWFSGQSIRIQLIHKSSDSKTVPLEASISDHAHCSRSKSKSKSTLQHKAQAPSTNPLPPPLPAPPLPGTPYYTPSQTRHGQHVEDTRQQGKGSPGDAKRQARRLSSWSVQTETTAAKGQNGRSRYDPVVGMSVLAVTLVIMIIWGRLCAIVCTSASLYCTHRFRKSASQNDHHLLHPTKSNHIDLDSDDYKKKVIMEGLLGRNHRATL